MVLAVCTELCKGGAWLGLCRAIKSRSTNWVIPSKLKSERVSISSEPQERVEIKHQYDQQSIWCIKLPCNPHFQYSLWSYFVWWERCVSILHYIDLSLVILVSCVNFSSCFDNCVWSSSLQAQLEDSWRFMEILWRRWCLQSLSLKRYLLDVPSTGIHGHVWSSLQQY